MWSEVVTWFATWPAGAISAAMGLVGVVVGAFLANWFSLRRDREQRRHVFIEKQLSEFYSPLVGLRLEVETHSTLRATLQNAAGAAWQDLCASVNPGPEAQRLTATRFPEFDALIQYDNNKLREKLMPAYRKMLDLFRDRLWLAEDETRKHYPALVEFVDVWERWLAKSLPAEVLQRIDHSEEHLKAFYAEIQSQHDRLRGIISKGKM